METLTPDGRCEAVAESDPAEPVQEFALFTRETGRTARGQFREHPLGLPTIHRMQAVQLDLFPALDRARCRGATRLVLTHIDRSWNRRAHAEAANREPTAQEAAQVGEVG